MVHLVRVYLKALLSALPRLPRLRRLELDLQGLYEKLIRLAETRLNNIN